MSVNYEKLALQVYKLCQSMNIETGINTILSRGNIPRKIRFLSTENSKSNYNDELGVLFIGNKYGHTLDDDFINEFMKAIKNPFPSINWVKKKVYMS